MKRIKVKNVRIITAALSAMLLMSVMTAFAQPFGNRGFGRPGAGVCAMIPDITEDQEAKINNLRTSHLKEMSTLRNQLAEHRAHLRTVSTADNNDMKEVNSTIDKITLVKNQLMKKSAAHRQAVRDLLTEEQRVYFDARPMNMGRRSMRGKSYGFERGYEGRHYRGAGVGYWRSGE